MTDPTYLGLTATNWILVGATLLGPISAVIITIVAEQWRQKRAARLNILQTILNTRQRPHDVQFQWAVMAVAIEFRKDKTVMAAHLAYMRHVGLPVPNGGELAHDRITSQLLSSLLKVLFTRTGSKMSEADIESLSYYTVGVGKRERLLEEALQGMVRIADTLEKSAAATEREASDGRG